MAKIMFHPEHLCEQSRKEIMRKIRVKYTHPSSEQNLKVKVKKIGETVAQSKVYIPPTDDFDPTDEVIDNLNYEAIKNGEIEDPDYDERSAEWPR